MNKDDKNLEKKHSLPVSANEHLPSHPEQDDGVTKLSAEEIEDNNNEDGFNERLRDRDAEMQQDGDGQMFDEEQEAASGFEEEASYERSRERGFDPLIHQRSTRKEVQQSKKENLEKDVEIDNFGRVKRGTKKSKFSFLNKLRLKNIAASVKQAFRRSAGKSNKDSGNKSSGDVSAYRHFSVNTPGNQAGIFDNTLEDNRERSERSVKETVVDAAAARQFLGHGMEAMQQAQEAAEQAVNKAATPYMEKLEHAREALDVACEVKDKVQGSKDILDQVGKGDLGKLDHDAVRALGMDIAGKGPSKGM